MTNSKFNANKKTRVSLTELKELMKGNTCNGLDYLEEGKKLFGTNLIAEVIYEVNTYTNDLGYNVYCKEPKVGYGRNNEKQVVYDKGFRLGTITLIK